jgi:hypothetical protein
MLIDIGTQLLRRFQDFFLRCRRSC